MLVTIFLGIFLGVWSAIQRGKLSDNVIRIFSTLWVGMPIFWFALLLQIGFYGTLEWLPAGGRLSSETELTEITGLYTLDSLLTLNFTALLDSFKHLLLPVLALALTRVAEVTRITRSSMLEVQGSDYVRTARAKGLKNRVVISSHSLRNALLPIITIFGLQFGYLLGGAVLVEAVFQWPGMGRYAVLSITSVDFPVVMGVAIVASIAFVLVNLIIDLLYVWADPRIEYN